MITSKINVRDTVSLRDVLSQDFLYKRRIDKIRSSNAADRNEVQKKAVQNFQCVLLPIGLFLSSLKSTRFLTHTSFKQSKMGNYPEGFYHLKPLQL